MKLQKTTETANPTSKARYDDACGTAHALELVGDRWALLILRELMLGGRRFSQLRVDLPGISANILTQRLGELETRGLLVRRKLPPPAGVQIYELTPWGYETEPIVQELGRWAARSPFHDPTLRISAVSSLMSLRTMFDPERARGIDAMIEFRFGEDVYHARLSMVGLAITRGPAQVADVVFDGRPEGLMAAVHGGVPLADLRKAGLLTVEGDVKLAHSFTKMFPLPPKLPG